MSLSLDAEKRAKMLARWFDLIVDRYPAETARFLREQRDPFANPVGDGLRDELAPLLDGVLDGRAPTELSSSLDRIVRVRALQDMSPSQAVGFVLDLKTIFREVAGGATADDVRCVDDRVDRLLLTAFDVFNRCREQLCEIRVSEIRNRSLKVMERLNEWRERRAGGPPSNA
jgi:hypothetical protein